eukprot:scaffold67160_cov28-Tisochrysis_lutea.AAC.7
MVVACSEAEAPSASCTPAPHGASSSHLVIVSCPPPLTETAGCAPPPQPEMRAPLSVTLRREVGQEEEDPLGLRGQRCGPSHPSGACMPEREG